MRELTSGSHMICGERRVQFYRHGPGQSRTKAPKGSEKLSINTKQGDWRVSLGKYRRTVHIREVRGSSPCSPTRETLETTGVSHG